MPAIPKTWRSPARTLIMSRVRDHAVGCPWKPEEGLGAQKVELEVVVSYQTLLLGTELGFFPKRERLLLGILHPSLIDF